MRSEPGASNALAPLRAGYRAAVAVFKLGSPTIARCGVCGGSVFADAHVIKARGRVSHAECVLYPRRRTARPTGPTAPAGSA